MANFNRFTHTKANDEIRPLITDYKEVQLNVGALVLKRTEGDGGSDRSLWPEIFPELNAQAEKPTPRSKNGLPTATLPESKYTVFTAVAEARNWASALAPKIASLSGEIFFGLDTEWNLDETRDVTRVLTISFPENVYSKVIVMDLTEMGVFFPDDVPKELRELLENKKLVPVAVNAPADLSRLRSLGVDLKRAVEIMDLAKHLQREHPDGYGMQALCARFLSVHVDKSNQKADWRLMKTSKDLRQYAALDPYLHRVLHARLLQLISDGRENGSLEIAQGTSVGRKVVLTFRNEVCASGVLKFVGGNGEIQWRNTTVGSDDSRTRKDTCNDQGNPIKKRASDLHLQVNRGRHCCRK
jgi:hypothetical protein